MKHYIISHTKQIPKTRKEIKMERVEVINQYFDGNLLRFLRRHNKQYVYQRVYTRYIKPWRKDKPELVELLHAVLKDRNGLVWPKHVKDVVNIMRTLELHYGFKLNKKCCKVALMIDDLFEVDIYDYHREHKQTLLVQDKFIVKNLTREQALKEQKAMGFIKSIKYEDHDWRFAHLQSNIDPRLIYPYNFVHDLIYNVGSKNIIYQVGMSLAGVQGFTRINIPKKS